MLPRRSNGKCPQHGIRVEDLALASSEERQSASVGFLPKPALRQPHPPCKFIKDGLVTGQPPDRRPVGPAIPPCIYGVQLVTDLGDRPEVEEPHHARAGGGNDVGPGPQYVEHPVEWDAEV
jgi:hypothetical protein